MSLSKEDENKLVEMQQLCNQVEQDIVKINEFKDFLLEAGARFDALAEWYDEDWLRVIDSEEIDDEQTALVEGIVPEGHYSILNQDTIWDALTESRDAYVQLLKTLADLM